jgi:hypothetical protein
MGHPKEGLVKGHSDLVGGPLDAMLDTREGLVPGDVITETVWVNDTLELCWASARQVFGEAASPETALAIFDRICARIARKEEE